MDLLEIIVAKRNNGREQDGVWVHLPANTTAKEHAP
jgi:hypothetical protein